MLSHKAIIFLVSDFLGTNIERPLKLLAQRHDVVAVTLEDPSERVLPDIGLVRLVDPETGETINVDTSNPAVRAQFSTNVNADAERRRHLLRRLAIDEIVASTPARESWSRCSRFFRMREQEAQKVKTWGRLVACAVTVALFGPLALHAQQIPVKAGITVAPETVKVADPFRVTVGIRAPRGATIEFPRETDSSASVQSLDPAVVRTSPDTTAAEQYADYRVAAWDIGEQPIRLADAIVRYNGE